MVELVDSETDSDDSSTEDPTPAPAPVSIEKPVEKILEVEDSPSPVAGIPASSPVDNTNVLSTEETARKIKEQFRCSMARVMVQHLNPYRHPDAPAARITCTADFKHLARKVSCVRLYFLLFRGFLFLSWLWSSITIDVHRIPCALQITAILLMPGLWGRLSVPLTINQQMALWQIELLAK